MVPECFDSYNFNDSCLLAIVNSHPHFIILDRAFQESLTDLALVRPARQRAEVPRDELPGVSIVRKLGSKLRERDGWFARQSLTDVPPKHFRK